MDTTKTMILDVETTGLDKEKDRVIEITIRPFNKGHSIYFSRINPGIPISSEISQIHGLTNEILHHCPSFGEIAEEVAKQIRYYEVIVGYNPDFDIEILMVEFDRAGCDVKWPKNIICCKRLWDRCDPPERRTLVNAYKKFVSQEGFEGAHGSLNDTRATMELFESFKTRYDLSNLEWNELDPERTKWVGLSNHFIWNDDRTRIIVNFGKHKDRSIGMIDKGFFTWILSADFPRHVKKLSSYVLSIPYGKSDIRDNSIAFWARNTL